MSIEGKVPTSNAKRLRHGFLLVTEIVFRSWFARKVSPENLVSKPIPGIAIASGWTYFKATNLSIGR